MPMPTPTHAYGFWVDMGAILLVLLLVMLQLLNTWAQFEWVGMGGHMPCYGWAWVKIGCC